MRTRKLPVGKLTDKQRYLLQRIPRVWDMSGYEHPPEPTEVKRARKTVEQWDKKKDLAECAARKRNEALTRKASEAVYFETPEKALAIVHQCEKMLKGCPV